jgi:ribosomal protein S18 acetylase RimI-like enzyme
MIIAPMKAEHVRSVASLHSTQLTGLLRALGPLATREFYTGSIESPRTIAFVALDGTTVRGFVWGSLMPGILKRESILRRPFKFTIASALGVLMRPSALPIALEMLRGAKGKYDASAPELTYLAVAPEGRRAGIGRQLVDAFSAAVRSAGATSYELSVDHDNAGAEAFYRKVGFEKVGSYREYGVQHSRYRLALGASA